MANTAKDTQAESTTYHGDVLRNTAFSPDEWLRSTAAALDRATLASKVAGGTFDQPHEWWAAREDARAAENTVVSNLVTAHYRLAVAEKLAGQHVDARVPCPSQASTILTGLGYSWSDTVGWVAPAPAASTDPLARAEVAAARQLQSMGWAWAGDRWQNERPAPSVLDMPLGQNVTLAVPIEKGIYNIVFRAETPVRALVEHIQVVEHKLARLNRACSAADDVLTSIFNGQNPGDAAIQAARNGLRQL